MQVPIQKTAAKKKSALDLLDNPPLRSVIIMSGLMAAAWELFGFYMPVFGHSIGLSASTIGVIMGTAATATFITRFFLPFFLHRLPQQKVLSWFMLVAAGGFVLLPLLGMPYAIAACAFVIGFGIGVAQPISMSMSYDRSPAGRAGEVAGLRLTANNLARVLIPMTAGSIGAFFGVAAVFWLSAGMLTLISWLTKR